MDDFSFPFGLLCSSPSDLLDILTSPSFVSIWFWASLLLLLYTWYQIVWQGKKMALRGAIALSSVLAATFSAATAQPSSTTSYRAIFTVPASVDDSAPLIPNIEDPQAVNAQDVCPGYTASNVARTQYGFTADLSLAGPACNVYGTDVESLILTVEYQSSDRLHVEITPTYVGRANSSWFVLPEELVPKPAIDADASSSTIVNDFGFAWSNDPTFSFEVLRQSTGDVLFSTTGTKLVYENQFIEFASSLPENYNLYGLGEVIHGLRMGNNFTRTFWAADVGDPIDTK